MLRIGCKQQELCVMKFELIWGQENWVLFDWTLCDLWDLLRGVVTMRMPALYCNLIFVDDDGLKIFWWWFKVERPRKIIYVLVTCVQWKVVYYFTVVQIEIVIPVLWRPGELPVPALWNCHMHFFPFKKSGLVVVVYIRLEAPRLQMSEVFA